MIFVYARPDARREVHHPGGWKHGSPVDAMVFDGDDGVERAEKPNHGRVHETDARHARRRHRRVPIPLRVFDAMRATRDRDIAQSSNRDARVCALKREGRRAAVDARARRSRAIRGRVRRRRREDIREIRVDVAERAHADRMTRCQMYDETRERDDAARRLGVPEPTLRRLQSRVRERRGDGRYLDRIAQRCSRAV